METAAKRSESESVAMQCSVCGRPVYAIPNNGELSIYEQDDAHFDEYTGETVCPAHLTIEAHAPHERDNMRCCDYDEVGDRMTPNMLTREFGLDDEPTSDVDMRRIVDALPGLRAYLMG